MSPALEPNLPLKQFFYWILHHICEKVIVIRIAQVVQLLVSSTKINVIVLSVNK